MSKRTAPTQRDPLAVRRFPARIVAGGVATVVAVAAAGGMGYPALARMTPAAASGPAATQAPVMQDDPLTASGGRDGASDGRADIAGDVRPLLEEVSRVYDGLRSLRVEGSVSSDFDVNGQTRQDTITFNGQFEAPDRFRHEVLEQALIVSDGNDLYLYDARTKQYLKEPAPKLGGRLHALRPEVGQLLQGQNLSLLLAMADEVMNFFATSGATINAAEPVSIDGVEHPVVSITGGGQSTDLTIDPRTHLIRRVVLDVKDSLSAQGVPAVRRATITLDYTELTPDVTLAQDVFAFEPPEGAVELSADVRQTGGRLANESSPLEGQPAPDFTLRDLNDEPVTLSSFRGSPVVLDFWATWCGPCQLLKPHLQQLQDRHAGQGLKVLSINLREAKPHVQGFLARNPYTIPVVLDPDGAVATQYGVAPIPHTVIIDSAGTVRRVVLGVDTPAIDAAVADVLAKP